MSTQTQLLFVCNADSGALNTLADIGYKIFSLARILHRDPADFRGRSPVFFCTRPAGSPPCLSAEQLKSCHDKQDLQQLTYT